MGAQSEVLKAAPEWAVRRARFWDELFRRWTLLDQGKRGERGPMVTAFCAGAGISAKTFYRRLPIWRRAGAQDRRLEAMMPKGDKNRGKVLAIPPDLQEQVRQWILEDPKLGPAEIRSRIQTLGRTKLPSPTTIRRFQRATLQAIGTGWSRQAAKHGSPVEQLRLNL